MAKKRRPRKPYRRPDFTAERARLNPEKYGPQAQAEQAGVSQSVEAEHPEPVHVDKEPVAPAHPHVTRPRAPRPSAPRASHGRGRYLVPVAAGAGIIGGGAFLAHRARRRKAEMAKGLIDPTTGQSVSYERVYLDDDVDKRHDESALEHHGSRRGGRYPVSTVRVSGLPVQSATFSRGNAEARPGTRSHALALTHVHTKVKHHPRGTLVRIGRGRSATPSPMRTYGKSAGYAQSAGSGRRLVSI